MAKITAVIDIGSNSVRMVVFEKTSRFGFHLLQEIKSKVRISEGAYERGGYLQPLAMERAVRSLGEFLSIARSYKASKVLCVATSAVRDAPNSAEFVKRVQRELSLSVRVIDGKKEAYFGALATRNLLPIRNAVTVDIGGGSTELALIVDGRIEELFSLNLGTVRLKELLFDKKASFAQMIEFVEGELSKLPDSFKSETIIGIGGTCRAIASAIMQLEEYPIDTLHGFSFCAQEHHDFIDKLVGARSSKLKSLGIKPERFDVIREGALILRSVMWLVQARTVVASGAGVREGVYLSDLLRGQNDRFPANFNPSVRSLLDRFCISESDSLHLRHTALALFDALFSVHRIDSAYKYHLAIAARLSNIGTTLSFYGHRHHDYYFVLNSLEYGFSHSDKLLIATLMLFCGKKLPTQETIPSAALLPIGLGAIRWLSFILSLAEALNADRSRPKLEFGFDKGALTIRSEAKLYLASEAARALPKPEEIRIVF